MRAPIALRRLGFRSAYLALRVYWFFARPRMHGVKCGSITTTTAKVKHLKRGRK